NRQDDVVVALDLQLVSVAAGISLNKPSTFELAFGFLNIVDAMKTNFYRGNGSASPNLVEFDYFPDTGFGSTVWPTFVSTNGSVNYNGAGDYTILDLAIGIWMHVAMNYAASNRTLTTSIPTNGVSIGAVNSVQLSSAFTDFRVGAFAIESYSDNGQDPRYGGSLLATGIVDNVSITLPPPPISNLH